MLRVHRSWLAARDRTVCLAFFVGFLLVHAGAQSTNSNLITNTPPTAAGGETNAPAEPVRDLVAARFLTTCAGCHSLTGAKLTGPELTPASAWPIDQLKAGIKKMEAKVGPLSDDVVTDLAVFLKEPDVRDRLKVEGERIAALFMAKMEPADPGLGRRLFFGQTSLRNGGLACAACHVAEGQGGNLAVPLNGIFQKTGGELPLISAIEQAKFKIMEPHFLRHPVTRQEAMHLAKYLATLDPNDTRLPRPMFASIGAAAAALLLVGMVAMLKTQRVSRTRDTRLQRRRK